MVSLLAIGIVFFVLRGVDIRQAGAILLTANLAFLVAVLFAQAISMAFRLVRWRFLLRPAKDVSLGTLVSPLLISYAVGNVTVTGVGGVPRILLLNRRSGIDKGFIAGTWVQEYLLDATAIMLWVAAVPMLVSLPTGFHQAQAVAGVCFGVLVAANGFLWWRGGKPTTGLPMGPGLQARIEKRLPNWVTTELNAFGEGLSAALRDPRCLTGAALTTALVWATEVAVFWLMLLSLNIPFGYLQASAVAVFTYLVTGVPAVPGFIGTLELSTVSLVLALGGEQAMALAYAVLLRLFFIGPVTVVGGLLAWREGWRIAKLDGGGG